MLLAQLWDDEFGWGMVTDLGDPSDEGMTWRSAALWPWYRRIPCCFLAAFLEDLLGLHRNEPAG